MDKMNTALTTEDSVRLTSWKLQIPHVINIDDLKGFFQVEQGVLSEELTSVIRNNIHIALVQNVERQYKLLCSDFSSCGEYIAKIMSYLNDKNIKLDVCATTDDICNNFNIDSSNKISNRVETKDDDSVSLQLLDSLLYDSMGVAASDTEVYINLSKNSTFVRYTVDKIKHPSRFTDVDANWGKTIGKCIFSLLPRERSNASSGEFNLTEPVNATFDRLNKRWRAGLFPADTGPIILIRELGKKNERVRSFEELGFNLIQTTLIRDWFAEFGMILVTGPTNSGKSTTLAAITSELNDGTRTIYEMADPVEILQDGLFQATVHEDNKSRTFESLGKQLLRQSPQVIVYGEIRTHETAENAIRMATTGHLVIGTFHTASSVTTPISLSHDLKIDNHRLCAPDLLKGIIYQRLVPRLCPHCALIWEQVRPTLSHYNIHRIEKKFCSEQLKSWRFFNSSGCSHCNSLGTNGLQVVAELAPIDSKALGFIRDGQADLWKDYLFNQLSWPSIKTDALDKVCAGVADIFACEKQVGSLTDDNFDSLFDPAEFIARIKMDQHK